MDIEVNFDGLIGPTHNYSGLSYGNIASVINRKSSSNPRAAALQGLEKMRFLQSLGLTQGILLPQERPHFPTLRKLGYRGTDRDIAARAAKNDPELYIAVCSAASMWAANAATISPSIDCEDGKVHITPANLISKLHRSIEPGMTAKILEYIFPNPQYFKHHPALHPNPIFGDEGAANQMRLCNSSKRPGLEIFVYGKHALKPEMYQPKIYPARHTYEASKSISRLHQIYPLSSLLVQQNPHAIDSGVFHNDVVAVANDNVLFFHELAFQNQNVFKEKVYSHAAELGIEPILIEVPEKQVPLVDAVATYLFNSQLVTLPSNRMALIAPVECKENPHVSKLIQEIIKDPSHPIDEVYFVEVRESMRNGGGPACLRLRVKLTEAELAGVNPRFILDDELYLKLKAWIQKSYRDRLDSEDLHDPEFILETQTALDELTQIFNVRPLYEFQS